MNRGIAASTWAVTLGIFLGVMIERGTHGGLAFAVGSLITAVGMSTFVMWRAR